MIEETRHYTALLLNCYVKQGGDKLKDLIMSSSFDISMLDTDTAIEVCKESNQLECAMLLAEKSRNIDQQLRLLIENSKEFKRALEIISKNISLNDQPKYLRRFGPQLIKELPVDTYKEIENVAGKLIDAQISLKNNVEKYKLEFKWLKEIFVDNDEFNKKFLDFQIARNPNCEKDVYHSLIEWQLQDYHKAESKKESQASIDEKKKSLMTSLNIYKEKYDKKHVLMLLEMFQVGDGVGLLCEMLDLKNELMTYYMQKQEYANIIKLCEGHGNDDQNLWVQALTYFVEEASNNPKDENVQNYVKNVLIHLEKVPAISPLMVLEIVSKNKSLKFSIIKEYLGKKLKKLHGVINKYKSSVNKLNDDIEKTKQNITNLRTTAQLFQLKECSDCGKKLELPIFHFMCNHSFHEYCIGSDTAKECPKCCIQSQQILGKKDLLIKDANNQEQFFKELKEGNKKFDVIAQYFGRGLFSDMEKQEKKYSEDKKEE